MDLISRKALVNDLCEDREEGTFAFTDEQAEAADKILRYVADRIGAQPAAPAVPVVHSRWQWLSSTYDRTPCEMRYMCDKCHHETITHGHKPWEKYCPNCGAKMDSEGQNEPE